MRTLYTPDEWNKMLKEATERLEQALRLFELLSEDEWPTEYLDIVDRLYDHVDQAYINLSEQSPWTALDYLKKAEEELERVVNHPDLPEKFRIDEIDLEIGYEVMSALETVDLVVADMETKNA